MKKIQLAVSTLGLLMSCGDQPKTPIIKDSITFNTGFETSYRYSGAFTEPGTPTEYLYFADPVTAKCLKIFTLKGELTDSVPLGKALQFIQDINGLSVRSKDTIILNSAYSNLLAIVNRKGDLIKKMEMDTLFKDNSGDHYELYSSFLAQKLFSNSIIFHSEWRYNVHDKKDANALKDLLHFNRKNYRAPYFCKVSYSGKPTITAGFNDFYPGFCNSNDMLSDIPRYTCVNNKLLVHTVYSNRLFVVDPTTLKLEKVVEIHSMLTTIGTKPCEITDEVIGRTQELSDSIMSTTGQCFGCFYNEQDSCYYLFIYHAVPSSLEKEIGYKKLPYSILKMEADFSNFTEYKMDAATYFGGFSIMTQQGLLINTPQENARKNTTSTRFTRFEFRD